MPWIEPVTDRISGAKYNHVDLNRVGECIRYLSEVLRGYGYSVAVEVKTDWVQADKPRAGQMETYLNNLIALINAYYTLPDTPDPPESINNLTWDGANNIEKNLVDIKLLLENMVANWRYSNDLYVGEGYFA